MQLLFLTGVGLGFLAGGAAMYLALACAKRRRRRHALSGIHQVASEKELTHADLGANGALPELELNSLKEANCDLQTRLSTAEALLSQQAVEIVTSSLAARTDPLTQVSNRRVFDEELARSLSFPRTHLQSVGVMLIDVDHFKRLNDQHGHLAGDTVLQQLASLLGESLPPGNVLARLGGEEFAVMVPAAELSELCQLGEALRQTVQHAIFSHQHEWLRITICCGTAIATRNENASSLLTRCDQALYCAKSAGRNAVFFHDGYRSHPVVRAAAVSEHDQQLAQLAREFQAVCHDLQTRLQQVDANNGPSGKPADCSTTEAAG